MNHSLGRQLTQARKRARNDHAARGLILQVEERSEDSRIPDPVDLPLADQVDVKNGIEIPHHPVRLEDGVLTSELAATDFVKAMSHELRTPLNVIIGLCQLLERDRESPLSSMQRDAVQRMERNARTLLGTVTQVLSHVKSGHFDSKS
jgi:signal transduction histidine kinase